MNKVEVVNIDELMKNHYNVSFLGHVDHGKSTMVGEILLASKKVAPQSFSELEKIAESYGKQSFAKAYLLDTTQEERKKGITIELSHKEFIIGKNHFTVIDCPGHSDFIKNAITGIDYANLIVLVLSGSAGIEAQTEEHITLAGSLQGKKLIVAINKMDEIDFSEEVYLKRKEEVLAFASIRGFRQDVIVLPTSGLKGINISEKSEKLPWYEGPCLFELLEKFELNRFLEDLPFRFAVEGTQTIPGTGVIITGNTLSGVANVGEEVVLKPSGITGKIASIEAHNQKIGTMRPGFSCGIQIKGVEKKQIKRGDILGLKKNPPKNIESFTAEVSIFNLNQPVRPGRSLVLHVGCTTISCKVEKVLSITSSKNKARMDMKEPEDLAGKERGVLLLRPNKEIVIEPLELNPQRCHFAIREGRETIGRGTCKSVILTEEEKFNLK